MEKIHSIFSETCPYCGGALEKGFLYTQGGIGLFFLRKIPLLHMLLSGHRLSKQDGSIVLDGIYGLRWNYTALPASVCRSCEIVIHSYHKE